MIALSAEVMGLDTFNEDIFKKNINQIIIPQQGKLIFVFHDGREIEKSWEYKPRSESWSEEKRQMTREHAINFLKERK